MYSSKALLRTALLEYSQWWCALRATTGSGKVLSANQCLSFKVRWGGVQHLKAEPIYPTSLIKSPYSTMEYHRNIEKSAIAMTTTLKKLDTPILIDGLTWREFKITEQLLDRPGIRLSFLDGVLEIRKMPGRPHETIKGRIGALLEAYLEQTGIDFTPTESMTLESEEGRVKREADKSYELGVGRDRPDLVIEIVVTSGGIDKLTAYQRLQIPKVWFWEKSTLSLDRLRQDQYEAIAQSEALPSLDIELLTRCLQIDNHIQALREFRQALLGICKSITSQSIRENGDIPFEHR
jgi:Uma2 family endonuclease